jgi:DNA mismatch repair protein MSH6
MSAKKKQSTLFRFFKPVEPNFTNEPVLTKDASAIAIAVDNKENVVTPKKINHELSDTEDQPVYIVNKIKKFKSKRIIEDDEMDIETPRRALKNFSYKEATQTPSIKPISSAKKNQTPSSSFTKTPSKSQKFKEKNETRYKWLLEIKDKDQNPPSHPDYDPKTLYIPPAAYQAFTPFEKQFWEIKSAHYNTIVFFKKGKFFELYENDATIGHQQFDLKLTDRVNMRMVGVPESSFHHWASQFIAKGYKVAKVEQMENAMGKKINDKNNKKDDKIIKRELTSVLTCGTLVDGGFLTTDAATYCMSIKVLETNKELIGTNEIKYGICFVDTATCEINVSCFSDDLERTQLETLITQINPKELVLQKTCSKNLLKIVKNLKADFNFLTDQEFWSFENTVDELQNYYYPGVKVDDFNGTLVKIMKDEMGTSALGGLLSYLRTVMIFDVVKIG